MCQQTWLVAMVTTSSHVYVCVRAIHVYNFTVNVLVSELYTHNLPISNNNSKLKHLNINKLKTLSSIETICGVTNEYIYFLYLQKNRTALMLAAIGNQKEMTRLLLEFGASVKTVDVKGYTALYLAAKYGNYEILKILLKEQEVDVNHKSLVSEVFVVVLSI